MGDFYETVIEIWAGFEPIGSTEKKRVWAGYEQLFMDGFFMRSGAKKCIFF